MNSKSEELQDSPFSNVSGVILAGGKSHRYGKDKAFVKAKGIPLIERVIEVMTSIFDKNMVITNTPEKYSYLGLPMAEDIIKDFGPLAGIHTALTVLPTDWTFVVGCDMPFLNSRLIRYMTERRDDYDVVVPETPGGLEALHGLYRRRCLPAVTSLINSGKHRIKDFFPEVAVLYIKQKEIARFDPEFTSFLNVNRPAELEDLNGTGHK